MENVVRIVLNKSSVQDANDFSRGILYKMRTGFQEDSWYLKRMVHLEK